MPPETKAYKIKRCLPDLPILSLNPEMSCLKIQEYLAMFGDFPFLIRPDISIKSLNDIYASKVKLSDFKVLLKDKSFIERLKEESGFDEECIKEIKELGEVTIEEAAFSNAKNLELVSIPSLISINISAYAFYNCEKLKKVVFSKQDKSEKLFLTVDNYAFYNCQSLEQFEFENSLLLGESAFSGCRKLKKADLSHCELECIMEKLFSGCFSLKEIVLPNSIKSIGDSAFVGTAIEKIVLPKSLEILGEAAFYTCTKLNKIVFNNRIKNIGDYAFNYCYSLEEIHIPSSITKIGACCFEGCSKLKRIIIDVPSEKLDGYGHLANIYPHEWVGKNNHDIEVVCLDKTFIVPARDKDYY